MENTKAVLNKTFDLFLDTFKEYYSSLTSLGDQERKKQISEYYKFCCKLTDILISLDSLTSNIANHIHTRNALNEDENVIEFSAMFENAIILRRIAEQFLTETESFIQRSPNIMSTELKKQTDIAIRKILMLKST